MAAAGVSVETRTFAIVEALPAAPAAQEEIPADTDFAFGPGDSFAWPPFVAGAVRNEGSEPATALVVVIASEDAATPTP